MAPFELPTQEFLCKILDYDPENGLLYWRNRGEARGCWNSRYAGKLAFYTIRRGYLHGMINSKPYKAHRVIWKMVYGSDPHYIDHINGDRTDNRISNLRSVTKAQNNRNKRLRSDNKSGVTGVHLYNPRNKWRVDVRYNGKTKHIGYFSSFDDAVRARKSVEKSLGYHPNNGRMS